MILKKSEYLAKISSLSNDKQDEDPFLRSGFVFGGVYREIRRRYAYFKSDFLDACSLHCFISLIFMFIACLAPALTFGGIIGMFKIDPILFKGQYSLNFSIFLLIS